MAEILQIVDSQVYTKHQIATRLITIEHEVAHLGAGVVLKPRLRSGKWYLKITVECVGQLNAMQTIIDLVKSTFLYSYSTSGGSSERTMRIGSTAERSAKQIAKETTIRRDRTTRVALFEVLWAKFTKDDVDFDVDYVSDLVDTILAAITRIQPK